MGMGFSAILFLIGQSPRGKPLELQPIPTPGSMVIQVSGAVNQPGVYSLPQESRIQDAVQIAGGFSGDARTEEVNLVKILRDGEKLIIPSIKGQSTALGSNNSDQKLTKSPTPSITYPVNINKAPIEILETLPGIGQTKAQQIIAYRQEFGFFKTLQDIQKIPGIGPVTYERLKDLITID